MKVTGRLVVCVAVVISTTALVTLLAGCGQTMTYSDQGGTYASSDLDSLFDSIDTPDFMGRPTAEATDLRHDQLASLRSNGKNASTLATLLTKEFPGESRSVPYYAEEGTVDGTSAWIVLEAWGSESGAIERLRLWVFDRDTGSVLYSTARNE